jgi:hypothetical protein
LNTVAYNAHGNIVPRPGSPPFAQVVLADVHSAGKGRVAIDDAGFSMISSIHLS